VSDLWNETAPAAQAPGAQLDAGSLPFGRPIRRRVGRRVLAVALLGIACLGLAVHRNLAQYKVTSGSMEPTLHVGERLAVDPGARTPRIGDIVVFHPPTGARAADPVCGSMSQGTGYQQPCGLPTLGQSSAVFIKRVVAGPGDTIAVVHGRAVRDGLTLAEPYAAPCDDQQTCNFPAPITVPAGEYYVLGDNRGASDDSRFWGPVPASSIMGTAVRCALFDTICHVRR
jgi:signal peptidase I